jgi:hypothetical protein
MQNVSDIREKISHFSDILEGDLERSDRLYLFGTHIEELLDREERENIAHDIYLGGSEDMIQPWTRVLQTRVDLSTIGLVVAYAIE